MAWKFIKSLPSVGVVEQIDQAGQIWQRQIQEFRPDFRWVTAHENRTTNAVVSPLEDRDQLLERLGRKRVTAFNFANAADWTLYRRTSRRCGAGLFTK